MFLASLCSPSSGFPVLSLIVSFRLQGVQTVFTSGRVELGEGYRVGGHATPKYLDLKAAAAHISAQGPGGLSGSVQTRPRMVTCDLRP